jgi:hypothetical protein
MQDSFAPRSSNISSASYDDETKVLTVEFNGGAEYEYSGVMPETFEAFRNSSSAGSFFHTHIKANYVARRV